MQNFKQIFKYQRVPDEPTIYIAITNKTDARHAPADSENWFVLLNMPYLAPGQAWKKRKMSDASGCSGEAKADSVLTSPIELR